MSMVTAAPALSKAKLRADKLVGAIMIFLSCHRRDYDDLNTIS
jgi:hypothetical protein